MLLVEWSNNRPVHLSMSRLLVSNPLTFFVCKFLVHMFLMRRLSYTFLRVEKFLMRKLLTVPIKTNTKMWAGFSWVTYSWGTQSWKSVRCLLVGNLLWGTSSLKRWEGYFQVAYSLKHGRACDIPMDATSFGI